MTDTEAKIEVLMGAYNKLTGYALTYRGVINPRAHAWATFINHGFTVTDLEVTLLAIKRRIKDEKAPRGMLGFQFLIGDIYRFEEELNRARAESRNAKPPETAKDKALSQLRPSACPNVPRAKASDPKRVSELLTDLRNAVEKPKGPNESKP